MRMPNSTDTCRYCKQPIKKGIKNCPYCNTVNPSSRVKEVMIWTVGMIVVLYIITYFMKG